MVRVVRAQIGFERRAFATPLRLSSGTIVDIAEARAEVTVTDGAVEATGRGAIYLSDLWAWPDPTRTPSERDAAMQAYARAVAATLAERTGATAHPLELGLRLSASLGGDDSPLPPLARLVCASPFDAALHDAAGKLAGRSAFALYDTDAPTSADRWFPGEGAIRAIRGVLRAPVADLDATLVVGKGDALDALESWIVARGYRFFKLKIGGADPDEDAARVAAVYRAARDLGAEKPRLTVDANCLTPDAATVERFLDTLAGLDAQAYAALEHVEQPTGRDIAAHAFDWREVAARKPLLLDEAWTDLETLALGEAQGWNGLALKTCKGHSLCLVAAAWARARGWTTTVMDLTNPGLAAIHSCLLAAHLTGVDAIELNAAQYTPDAHEEWLPRLAPLLTPRDGAHRLPFPIPVGLGTEL